MSDNETTESAVDPAEIRLAAMNLLARREHTVWELRRKLRPRCNDESVLERELSRLAEQNLQSDTRFAESYIRQRINIGYGPVRLREELRQRGISRADIAQLMNGLEIDWHERAMQVLQNKFGNSSPGDLKEAARRARFMQHRGFTAEHYQSLLRD